MRFTGKMFKTISFVFVALTIVIWAISMVQAVPPKKSLSPSDYANNMTWQQAVKSKKPMAVNFYVDWCGYCRKFAPILESLEKEYGSEMNFVYINSDDPKNSSVVRDFVITGYPTLYLVNPENDNRVFINQAIYSKKDLLKKEFDRFLKVN